MTGSTRTAATATAATLTDDFSTTVPRFTGGLSAISSAIIIILILRSRPKLSTIYHRIIFVMSCADILSSVAMALTTLPMPPEGMLDDGIVEHYWSGPRLGNNTTCSIQGFCFIFGLHCMLLYNASLWTYYACAIAFEIEEGRIKTYIERPFLHSIPLLISAIFACIPAVIDWYHPISNTSWCTINSMGGSGNGSKIQLSVFVLTVGWLFVHIIACFALVIRRVVKNQRILNSLNLNSLLLSESEEAVDQDQHQDQEEEQGRQDNDKDHGQEEGEHRQGRGRPEANEASSYSFDNHEMNSTTTRTTNINNNQQQEHQQQDGSLPNTNETIIPRPPPKRPKRNKEEQLNLQLNMAVESQRNIKVITLQALAYILTLLISLSPPVFRAIVEPRTDNAVLWVVRLQVIFMPLQGFFNAIIFVSHKVYNYKQVYPNANLSICRILYLLLVVGREEPVLVVTGLSIVQGDREREREREHDERERIIEEYEKRKEQKKLELMEMGGDEGNDGNEGNNGNGDEVDNRKQKRNVNWDDSVHHDHYQNNNENGNQAPQLLSSSSALDFHGIDVDYIAAQSMTSFGDLSALSPSLQLYYHERSTLGPPSENDEITEAYSKSKGISRFFAPTMHLY